MADGWLDSGTRIPFAGIIGIVVIVAVVALFIKVQLEPLFPAAEITVEDENSLTGRATSDTFYGMREVDLHRKEVLRGSLNRGGDAIDFMVDIPNKELTMTHDGEEEQVLLTQQEELLHATFEYQGLQTAAAVDARQRTLRIGTEQTAPVSISLGDDVIYTGSFKYKAVTYPVIFSPAAATLQIGSAHITLTQNGAFYSGTWEDGRQSKPVRVDMRKQLLVIEEIY